MGRFLFVAYHGVGHVLPALSVATALQQRGHWVGVYCAASFAPHVTGAGLVHCPPRAWHEHAPLPPATLQTMWAGANVGALILQYRLYGSLAAMIADIEQYARTEDVQAIIGDVLMPGGGIVAERLGLPWASITMCPIPVLQTYRHTAGEYFWSSFDLHAIDPQVGLPPQPGNLLDRLSPLLHLVPATPYFVGDADQLPAQIRCVGPLSAPEPTLAPALVAELRDAPAPILVTLSSERPAGFGRSDADVKRYLRAVIDGLADEPVTVIITTSIFQQGIDIGALPANIHIAGFVSHEALMPYLTAAIVHGGWGGIGRALRHGLPMVIVPFGQDQPFNAARCQELGFGLNLSLADITASTLRTSLRTILDDPGYRSRVQQEADRIRALNPVQRAAEDIAALLDRG